MLGLSVPSPTIMKSRCHNERLSCVLPQSAGTVSKCLATERLMSKQLCDVYLWLMATLHLGGLLHVAAI